MLIWKQPKVKIPKAEQAPPAPTVDDAARDRNESERLRRRRGSQSNQHTGPLGAPIPSSAAPVKTLTGQ